MTNCITPAFLLKSVHYKDNDLILTLYTKSLGKVSAIAKGARSSRKRFLGAIEPFALIEVSLSESRRGSDGLMILSEAELRRSFEGLAEDLERMGVAAYILELIKVLTAEKHPDERLFDLVLNLFHSLIESKKRNPRSLAIASGLKLFEYEGLAITVDRCIVCSKKLAQGKKAMFDPQRGGIVCTSCGGGPMMLSAGSMEALTILSKDGIEGALDRDFENRVLAEIEEVLDRFCVAHIDFPLKTTRFRAKVGETGSQGGSR